jgi:hypothetical protein
MSSEDVLVRLQAREPSVPPELHARMEAALAEAGESETVAIRFGESARVCLRAALAAGEHRSGALDLLAADALLTLGAEAAAEEGSESLEAFAARFGVAAMHDLLPEIEV